MKNIRLQYAAWEDLPVEFQQLFIAWSGNDAERGKTFYELYFYWFDIPHEVGHVLREQYGLTDSNHWNDETAVNTFAVAYWQQRGENQRLQQLREFVRTIFSNLQDPLPLGEDRASYFNEHYSELATNPPAFGHFHFDMVLAALDNHWDWQQTLRSLISATAKEAVPTPTPLYASISADLPTRIVHDMRAYLIPYGLELPEMNVVCSFAPELLYVVWD